MLFPGKNKRLSNVNISHTMKLNKNTTFLESTMLIEKIIKNKTKILKGIEILGPE